MLLAACALLLLPLLSSALAQGIDPDTAAKVKAGYLLNFARYTQWPPAAFPAADSPIVMTLVGSCDVAAVLPEVVAQSDPIGGRRVQLQAFAPAGAVDEALLRGLERSHLVYVCSGEPDLVRTIVEHAGRATALTVGDIPDFAASGGMIGFILREGRILFEANPHAIQSSQVTLSAKVLKLARIVEPGGGR